MKNGKEPSMLQIACVTPSLDSNSKRLSDRLPRLEEHEPVVDRPAFLFAHNAHFAGTHNLAVPRVTPSMFGIIRDIQAP